MSNLRNRNSLKVKMVKVNTNSTEGPSLSRRRLSCEECNADFCSSASLRRHVYEQHARRVKLNCPYCSKMFARKHDMGKHCKKAHKSLPLPSDVPNNLKKEHDTVDQPPDSQVPIHTRKGVCLAGVPQPEAEVAEGSPVVSSPPSPSESAQETGIQASEVEASNEAGEIHVGQRVIERITKELLDEDGKVVARVITERFLVD